MKPTTQLTLYLEPIPTPEPQFVLLTEAPTGDGIRRGLELSKARDYDKCMKKMTTLFHFYRPERD